MLQTRAFDDVTQDDFHWADAYLGAAVPDGIDLSSVRWVHSPFAGVDALVGRPDLAPPTLLTRTTGQFGERIGEYCLARILYDLQRLPALQRAQRAHAWQPVRVGSLRESRILVVGTGSVGSGIARVLAANGCRVHGVSLRGRPQPPFASVFPSARLVETVTTADYIVATVPRTPGTRHLLNERVFEACRGAFLINVGRGQTVDEAALLAALEQGTIRGCALDVFQVEPLPEQSPLWDRPDVLISPHMAAVTRVDEAGDSFLSCLSDIEAGIRPRLAVDWVLGY